MIQMSVCVNCEGLLCGNQHLEKVEMAAVKPAPGVRASGFAALCFT